MATSWRAATSVRPGLPPPFGWGFPKHAVRVGHPLQPSRVSLRRRHRNRRDTPADTAPCQALRAARPGQGGSARATRRRTRSLEIQASVSSPPRQRESVTGPGLLPLSPGPLPPSATGHGPLDAATRPAANTQLHAQQACMPAAPAPLDAGLRPRPGTSARPTGSLATQRLVLLLATISGPRKDTDTRSNEESHDLVGQCLLWLVLQDRPAMIGAAG